LPYAKTSFVLRACKPLTRFNSPCDPLLRADTLASTTSHPAFVTTRDRPSYRNETAGVKPLIWGPGEAEYCPSCQTAATRRAIACRRASPANLHLTIQTQRSASSKLLHETFEMLGARCISKRSRHRTRYPNLHLSFTASQNRPSKARTKAEEFVCEEATMRPRRLFGELRHCEG
jgi:hypothetical protein